MSVHIVRDLTLGDGALLRLGKGMKERVVSFYFKYIIKNALIVFPSMNYSTDILGIT